jgi:exopolysaccharide production protein ExoZ
MSASPQQKKTGQRKLQSIQILRGLAAGSVVIAHVIEHPSEQPNNEILTLGLFGVIVFFAISGFIIAHINNGTSDARFDPVSFLVRRFFRLVPLYWACTLLTYLCALFLPSLFKNTTADLGYLISSLFFIPATVPGDPSDWRPLLKLGWSLNYEVFFYLVFAACFFISSSLKRTIALTVVFGAMAATAFVIPPNSGILSFYLNFSLLAFIGGLWLAEAERRRLFDSVPVMGLVLMALIALAALGNLFSLDFRDFAGFYGYKWLVIAALSLVALSLACERLIGSGLLVRGLVKLGDVSYSLYLTHMFVVGFGWFVIRRLALGEVATVLGMALIVIVAVIGSLISYAVIEQPFNHVGRLATRGRGRRAEVSGEVPSEAQGRG